MDNRAAIVHLLDLTPTFDPKSSPIVRVRLVHVVMLEKVLPHVLQS